MAVIQSVGGNDSVTNLTLAGLVSSITAEEDASFVLDDECVRALCDALRQNETLAELDISESGVTESGFHYIVQTFRETPRLLKQLRIRLADCERLPRFAAGVFELFGIKFSMSIRFERTQIHF